MLARRMNFEPLEPRATPAVLIGDSFASLAFDPAFWDTATLANIAPTAAAESAPLAARFNGNAAGGDELRSVVFPLSGATSATLSYSFQRTGAGTRPAPGEDLVIEMRTSGGEWSEVARHAASEPDMPVMARRSITVTLPVDATTLQLRVRQLGTRSQQGDYWLDDISLVTGNGEISGRLWFDRDADAAPGAGELSLAGWTVFADANHNGALDAGEPQATTDDAGGYTLVDLPPGPYAIRPDLPEGWFATGPERSHFALGDEITAADTAGLAGVRTIVASGDGRFLYAAGGGAIVVLGRDPAGNLGDVQRIDVAGGGFALLSADAITLSPDARSLYAVSAESDAIAVFDRDDITGVLSWRATLRAVDIAGGFDFPAAVSTSGDGRHVYVAASNSATVVTFDRDPTTGNLTFADALGLSQAGLGGASALALSPDGRHVYVAASGDRALVALARDVATGRLAHVETLYDDTARANGLDGASAAAVSPDGRFVIVAGGFDDALAIFARDAATGRLEFRDLATRESHRGAALDGPQSIAFSSDGGMLLAAAINDDAITAFRFDAERGSLWPVTVLGGAASATSTLDGVRAVAPLTDGGFAAAAFHRQSIAVFSRDAAQANLTLRNDERATAVDFGLSRDAARWSGAGSDGLWSTAGNWHGNVVPQSGEAVQIGAATGGAIASVNDFAPTLSIGGLSLLGAGVTLTGEPLDISAAGIVAVGGPHVVDLALRLFGPATVLLGDAAGATAGELIVVGDIDGDSLAVGGTGRARFAGNVALAATLDVAEVVLETDGAVQAANLMVDSQATLAGHGLVAAPVAVAAGANLSPGENAAANGSTTAGNSQPSSAAATATTASIGTLRAGELTLAPNATFAVDILADEATATHDAVIVTGGVSLDGATIAFVLSGRLPIDVEYVLIDNDSVDPVAGQFAGVAEGTYFDIEGQRFRLSYTGGDGNDVTIYAPPTGEVLGGVWHDANSNRVRDAEEGPLADWTVFADLNNNGQLDAGEPTALTDTDGNYHLDRVPVGRSRILPLVSAGWRATTPAPMTDFINHVETQAAGAGGAAPHLDGVRGVAVSPDGRHLFAVSNNDDALVVFRRDTLTGRLAYVGEFRDGVNEVNGLNGARGAAASRDGRNVYVAGYFDDAIAVFGRDPATGELTYLEAKLDNTLGSDGLDGATAVVVSPDDRHVYVAGYLDDAVAVFARDAATGRLSYAGRVRDGVAGASGLDGAHGLAISPDGKHVYVAAANSNAVAMFRRDATTGLLTFAEALVDGQGGVTTLGVARSVAVSPDGRFVFAAAELDNAVTTFRRDAATGLLTVAATARNGSGGVAGLGGATALVVSPDGERVYAVSAGDDAVVAFDVDRTSGALTYREHLAFPATAGLDGAAAVALSPDGDHVYVAGPNSDAVTMVARVLPPDVVSLSPGEIVTGIDHGAANPPPTVVAIAARSSGWSSAFLATFNDGTQLVAGLSLSADGVTYSAHGRIDEIAVRFSEDVVPELEDLAVFGVARAVYRPVTFTYDAASFTAVWRLEAPIDADRVLVRVAAALQDAGGAALGADVTRRLDVLAGSADGSPVEPPDLARVLAAMFARLGSPEYSATYDLNGDGAITYVDAILARNFVGQSLPGGEPVATEVPPLVYAPPPPIVVRAGTQFEPVAHAAPPPIVVRAPNRAGAAPAASSAVVLKRGDTASAPAVVVAAARRRAVDLALGDGEISAALAVRRYLVSRLPSV